MCLWASPYTFSIADSIISLKDYAQYPDTCIERALKEQFKLGPQDIQELCEGLGSDHQQRLLFILDGYDVTTE
jgi:hypothetical protein